MSSKNIESIKDLLRKIHALAVRGESGEAETARKKLDELLGKYELKEDDLFDEKRFPYPFACNNKDEFNLLVEVYCKVLDVDSMPFVHQRGSRLKGIQVELTKAEHAEVSFMYEYYWKAFRKEKKRVMQTLYQAFIVKHKIFSERGNESDQEKENTLSKEEIRDILAMVSTLKEPSLSKARAFIEE